LGRDDDFLDLSLFGGVLLTLLAGILFGIPHPPFGTFSQ